MGDAARQHESEPEVIDAEGVDVTDTSTSEVPEEEVKQGEVIDMQDFREQKEAEKAAEEEAKLAEDLAEAGSIANTIASKIAAVMENPTVRKYMQKAVNVADDVCQSTINEVWKEMPDEVKWGVMYYPNTAPPDPYILSFQTLARCGMLDVPADFEEKDYVTSNVKLAEQVAKYGKNIFPELKVADKLVNLATKVNWLMDESFYKHVRSMVREKRAGEGTMAANDNAEPVEEEKVYDIPDAFKDFPEDKAA